MDYAMNMDDLSNPGNLVIFNLEERNKLATETINRYVELHTGMDIGIGILGTIIPGAAVLALIGAIGAQGPVIYQPLARKLAKIYLASPDQLVSAQDDIIAGQLVVNLSFDIAAQFGLEFLKPIIKELLFEIGIGAVVGAAVPIIGGGIAAWLDYEIAKRMTNRVGRMVAIYFQNNSQWIGSKQETYQTAKSLSDDLNDIRFQTEVRKTQLKQVYVQIQMMKNIGIDNEKIKSALRSQKIPEDLINEGMKKFE